MAWETDLHFPAPAPVIDEVGLLSASEVQQLTDLLVGIKKKSNVEVGVYIPASLQEREIADFSIALADQWKLGKKKEDKGLIILIAPNERKMRIEVGYGLEGELTDIFTKRILDNVFRPNFRRGNYYGGIIDGLFQIQQKIPLGLEELNREKPFYESNDLFYLFKSKDALIIFFFLFIFLILIPSISIIYMIKNSKSFRSYRTYESTHSGWGSSSSWGRGGFGGGRNSWGGGGGGFGGGGASSSW